MFCQTPDTIEGETIFVSEASDQENKDSTYLCELLEGKTKNELNQRTVEPAEDCSFNLNDIEEDVLEEIKNLDFKEFYK